MSESAQKGTVAKENGEEGKATHGRVKKEEKKDPKPG